MQTPSNTTTISSSSVTPRPHQLAAIACSQRDHALGFNSQLINLPTGAGKTITAAFLARDFKKTLFLVHRESLLEQTRSAFERAGAEQITILRGNERAIGPSVTIAMLQTIINRLDQYERDAVDLLIIDEAHHMGSKTWTKPMLYFKPKLLVGLSATPERADGANLGLFFEKVSYAMTIRQAIEQGILVTPKALTIRTNVSLAQVRLLGTEFNEKDLNRAVNTSARNALIVEKFAQHAHNRRAVMFTAGVEHAEELARCFRKAHYKAVSVSGEDKTSPRKLEAFKRGEYQIVINAALLTEGWDDPSCDAVFVCRPVRSKSALTQMIGRALRLHPGKSDALIVNFFDQAQTKLASVWDIFGVKKRESDEQPIDLGAALQNEVAKKDAAELAERYQWLFGKQLRLESISEEIDCLEPPPEQGTFDYTLYPWSKEPASPKQIELLQTHGYDTTGELWNKGMAAAIIDAIPATQKQLKLLLAQGFNALEHDWTRQQAKHALADTTSAPDWGLVNRLQFGAQRTTNSERRAR